MTEYYNAPYLEESEHAALDHTGIPGVGGGGGATPVLVTLAVNNDWESPKGTIIPDSADSVSAMPSISLSAPISLVYSNGSTRANVSNTSLTDSVAVLGTLAVYNTDSSIGLQHSTSTAVTIGPGLSSYINFDIEDYSVGSGLTWNVVSLGIDTDIDRSLSCSVLIQVRLAI